ncbi:hypothetical protein M408DRAFT_24899 [Serendipita vermifera MAFF 305830]|uniref:F-box domain-containing protein n=1 Tax=Serendipita vermifera MAFF 305830 TaxID=933852 RepID=A0A0C3B4R3_SERVB|nr:hypothetical protein M408DRAFT_24899 [Serendipita vermifera MAFF 305830]
MHQFGLGCPNLDSLARLILRAGTGFHLTLGPSENDYQLPDDFDESFLNILWNGWVDGIQSLSISRGWKDEQNPFLHSLGKLLHHNSLKSLKSVSCNSVFSSIVIEKLLPQMKSTALELTTLDIKETDYKDDSPISSRFWLPFPLGRISSLYLECWLLSRICVPWSELTSLKFLYVHQYGSLTHRDGAPGLVKIEAPHLSSLRICSDFDPRDFVSHKLLENLSRLALDCPTMRRLDAAMCSTRAFSAWVAGCYDESLGYDWERVYIPSRVSRGMVSTMAGPRRGPGLSALHHAPAKLSSPQSLDFCMAHSIELINAPELVDLKIDDCFLLDGDSGLFSTPITPRILHVTFMCVEEKHSRLSKCFKEEFSNAHVWSRVEELHVTSCEDELHHPFIQLLKGHAGARVPCFPKLACLTVRYYTCSEEVKMHRINRLLHVMRARIKAGLPRFTTLEVGWMAVSCRPEVRWGEEEWFATEWRDCLQENKDEEWEEDEEEESDD